MTAIRKFPITGYALINGTHLNQIVSAVNNLTGNGTPQAATVTTLNASGTITGVAANLTGAANLSGGLTTSGARVTGITTVAAAGASQGNATAIAASASVVVITVTASTEGVKLPTAATGKQVYIFADPAVGNKVYAAAAGQKIGAATTATTAYALVKNTATVFLAKNATNWLVLKGG